MSDEKHLTEQGFGRRGINRRNVLKTIGVGVGISAVSGLSVGTATAEGFDDLCEAVPLDVVLVLDRSGSMAFDSDRDGKSKLQEVQDAASEFIDRLTSTDRIGVVSFATDVTTDSGLTDDFSAVKSSVDGLTAGGSTNLGGGVKAGREELNANGRSDATPILVVLSNGQANAGPDEQTEAQKAKDDGIRLITIAFGTGADEAGLKQMASDPTEDNFFDAQADSIGDVFETITKEICPTVVEINIKPGSDPNAVNCGKKGSTPVAVLTTDDFDATTVDPSSLRFGSPSAVIGGDGAELVHGDGHLEDAKPDHGPKDGDTDFVGHFSTPDAGFTADDTEGWLVGKTMDGRDIAGRDSVKIVGNCKK